MIKRSSVSSLGNTQLFMSNSIRELKAIRQEYNNDPKGGLYKSLAVDYIKLEAVK